MRPKYHYAPAANWLSDPNGLVHHAGEWHLFYQYNPEGEDWGHMSWGHAVSPDLATWEELPPALLEDERHLIFSGSAVIDRDNSATPARVLAASPTRSSVSPPAPTTAAPGVSTPAIL
jgi:sucrose-6-phosphate hydrolase SacC (GH32 family)